MKKYLLFIISMLCTSIGAWADISISYDGNTPIINTENDPDLSSLSLDTKDPYDNFYWAKLGEYGVSKMVVKGSISEVGLQKIQSVLASYTSEFNGNNADEKSRYLDLTQATFSGTVTSLQITDARIPSALLPAGTDVSGINFGSNIKYAYAASKDGGKANLYVSSSQTDIPSQVTSDIETIKTNGINVSGDGADAIIAKLKDAGVPEDKIKQPYNGKATAVGGHVQTDVEAACTAAGAEATDVKNLTVSGGTLTNDDVYYMTGTLTGLTTVDLTGTSATGDQIWDLLSSSHITTIKLGADNLAQLKNVSGKTFTSDILAKIGVSASSLASGMTTTNYFIDGTTLIVTGNIDSSVDNNITSILSNNSSITTLDVANATNTSEYTISENTQLKTVSLPGSGYVKYGGDATKLIDGVLVVSLGEGGDYNDVAAMTADLGTLLGTVEHVKITGTLTESDLSNLFTADPSDSNKTLVCGKSNIKTLDLSDATKLDNSVWTSNAKGSPCETAVLLPAGTDLTNVNDWNGWGTNFFSIDGSNNKQLNLAVGYAGSDIDGRSLKNGTYFTEKLGATSLKVYNGRSGSGASGATALNAFATYSGDITLVDLTSAQANSDAGLAEARANLALTKTVLSPIESENLIVSGTVTNDILATINALTGNIKSIDFRGVTGTAVDGNGNAFDWNNLTGPASVGYVLLPGSESANVKALTGLTNLKAAGALDGTKASLHVYNEETGEKGATNEFDTTFSDPFATATSLKLSSAAAMNTTSADLTNVINSTVTLVDISEANFGELIVKDNLKLPQPSTTTDLVVADGLNTAAGLNAYAVSGITGVFSHDGKKLAMLSTGNNTNIASRVAAIKKDTENTLSVNSADYKIDGNGVTLANFNDVDVETLEFNQTNYSSDVIANTHIKNLLMSNAYSAYLSGRSFDISGCTNLEKADFTQQLVNRINATNLDNLKDLYVNHATFKEALDKTASPKKGVVDVTRSSNNYDNLKIHAESAFDWNRVVPDLDKENHYSDAANTPYIFTNSIMALHEPTDTEKYCFWYGKDNDVVQENGELKISMTNELRGTLGDILDKIGSKTFTKVTITGPMTQTDVAALSKVNAKTLDLSGATLQRATKDADDNLVYTNDVTVLNTGSEVNNNIRFVILPSAITRSDLGISYDTTNSDKTVVNSSLLSSFTGLYTALAYNSTTNTFTTYVKKEGTMQPAVVAAGYGSLTSAFTPAGVPTEKVAYAPSVATTMDNLIVTGNVNAYDLAGNAILLDTDGHLSYDKERTEASVEPTNGRKLNGTVTAYGGINGASLKIFDMKDAAFGNYKDMTLSALGGVGNQCRKIVISQVPSVKILPADFLNVDGIAIHCYCIPSNIEVIQSRAFITADYIWTTPSTRDPEGLNTQLDNGIVRNGVKIYATDIVTHEEDPDFDYVTGAGKPSDTVDGGGTYTFSSSIKLIESGAFPDATPCVKDVYVLNTEAPECHVDAFNTVMYIGNGGYSPVLKDGIITRDSYRNNSAWITMLHYPRQTTTPNVQRYTDPTRDYSIATGERDGKGAMIYFPNQSEFLRAYMQGTYGYTWNAWNPERAYGSVKNEDLSSVTLEAYNSTTQAKANAEYNRYKTIIDNKSENLRSNIEKNHPYYSFYDVTAGVPTNKPEDLVDYNTIYWDESSYNTTGSTGVQLYPAGKDYRGWHQFVLNAYAANTTVDVEEFRSYITDNEWWTYCPTFDITREQAIAMFGTDDNKIPYISKLLYVRRDYENNVIALNFSDNLMLNKEKREKSKVTVTKDNDGKVTAVTRASQHGTPDQTTGVCQILKGTKPDDDDVVMSAGVPYMIKPFMPEGGVRMFQIYANDSEAQKVRNQYQNLNTLPFKQIVSEPLYNLMKFTEQESGKKQMELVENGLYSVPVFVKGNTQEKTDKKEYTIEGSKYAKSENLQYTFVGTFYKSYLPGNCYFLGWDSKNKRAKFFYNDKPDANVMRWINETGIICPTAPDYTFKVTEATPGAEGEPAQWKIGEDKTENEIKTYWLNNDDLSNYNNTSSAPALKSLQELFGSPEVSGVVITGLDGVSKTNTEADSNKVYSLSGQYMGNNVQGLAKGVYIVNGKKYVVK